MASPSLELDLDLSGQILDRYRLIRRLGVGGMGAVYEAEHTRLRKRFAVKLLRDELARNEIFRKRFLREARAASAVTHPNVVAISDFGEIDDGHVYFVMEMLTGRDLQELLNVVGKLPWPRARNILLQVTSALEAAHLQDIIHRDIKPSNVFLSDVPGKGDEDFVKVLDFGIAKLSGNLGEGTAKLTSTDEIFGTVAYMAPEMAMGTNDDRRSDVYAVGVMMYRMLTGVLPFTQGNAFQILSQHIHTPVPSPREKEPSISEAIEAIILKALTKPPDDRFQSMMALAEAIRLIGKPGLEVSTMVQPRPEASIARTSTELLPNPATQVEPLSPDPAPKRIAATEPLESARNPPTVLEPKIAVGRSITLAIGAMERPSVGATGTAVVTAISESPSSTAPSIPSTTTPRPIGSTHRTMTSGGGGKTSTTPRGKRVMAIPLLVVLSVVVFLGMLALGGYIARNQGSSPAEQPKAP